MPSGTIQELQLSINLAFNLCAQTLIAVQCTTPPIGAKSFPKENHSSREELQNVVYIQYFECKLLLSI